MPDIHGCKSAKLAAVSKPVESHGSLPPIRKARPAVRPAAQGQLRGSSDGGGTRGAPWARVSPVPTQMWVGEPSPGADVGGASPVPVQMFR